MRALYKEVAPKTYAENVKKGLFSSTYAPPSLSSSSFSFSISSSLPLTSSFPPTSKEATSSTTSATSPISTRGKKK